MKIVFLSGPIRGLSRQESMAWRIQADKLLKEKCETIHALRRREERETLPDPRIAVQRDKADIARSDILLVNDTFENSSMIGTSMEVLYAHKMNKLVIIFGRAHEKDYWLGYHSHVTFDTLEEACSFILDSYYD
jgi:hypothetical protein